MVEEFSHDDLVVVCVRVLDLYDPRLLQDSEDEVACFNVGNGDKDGPSLLGLEYALLFVHVLVVWVGGNVEVLIIGCDVFKMVEGMGKAGGVFGLWFDEPGEVFLLPMAVKTL